MASTSPPHLVEHDVDVELVVFQLQRRDPRRALEEQVELFLLVRQLRRDVEEVLLFVERTVPVLCRCKQNKQ